MTRSIPEADEQFSAEAKSVNLVIVGENHEETKGVDLTTALLKAAKGKFSKIILAHEHHKLTTREGVELNDKQQPARLIEMLGVTLKKESTSEEFGVRIRKFLKLYDFILEEPSAGYVALEDIDLVYESHDYIKENKPKLDPEFYYPGLYKIYERREAKMINNLLKYCRQDFSTESTTIGVEEIQLLESGEAKDEFSTASLTAPLREKGAQNNGDIFIALLCGCDHLFSLEALFREGMRTHHPEIDLKIVTIPAVSHDPRKEKFRANLGTKEKSLDIKSADYVEQEGVIRLTQEKRGDLSDSDKEYFDEIEQLLGAGILKVTKKPSLSLSSLCDDPYIEVYPIERERSEEGTKSDANDRSDDLEAQDRLIANNPNRDLRASPEPSCFESLMQVIRPDKTANQKSFKRE